MVILLRTAQISANDDCRPTVQSKALHHQMKNLIIAVFNNTPNYSIIPRACKSLSNSTEFKKAQLNLGTFVVLQAETF